MPHVEQQTARHTLIGRALDWWHGARDRWRRLHELDGVPDHDLELMAHDIGLSTGELRRLGAQPNGTELLLERRLLQLQLDPEDIRKLSPLLLNDLERTCALCRDKARCGQDFKDGTHAGWESYCPNAGTLQTLT